VKIAVMNFTDTPVTVTAGDRIAQGIFLTAPRVEWIETADVTDGVRGGFGSSG
jgi:dUTPase